MTIDDYQIIPFPYTHPIFGKGKYQKRWEFPNGYILSVIWGISEDPANASMDIIMDSVLKGLARVLYDHLPEKERTAIKMDGEKAGYELFIVNDPTGKETQHVHGTYTTLAEAEKIVTEYFKR